MIRLTHHDEIYLCPRDALVRRRLVRHEEVPGRAPGEGHRAAEVEHCLSSEESKEEFRERPSPKFHKISIERRVLC